jgi:nucleoside-diphosphate-sugar epimerase
MHSVDNGRKIIHMKKVIVVAGATGDLGMRIVKALIRQGAEVRALIREESTSDKIDTLTSLGADVRRISWTAAEIAKACAGASCVVSVVAGLREVVIDAQKILLDGAVAAGVPRFIPSDYSLDFLLFSPGENRNLDWRREFHQYLDKAPIKATSIFNGAFMDMITNEMPMILFKQKRILYWGDVDHPMCFTTKDNIAAYTAHAALESTTPRYLHICGDLISPRGVQEVASRVLGDKYGRIRPGGQGLLGIFIKIGRALSPAKNELYPAWQGMQYMHNMIDRRADLPSNDSGRYPDIKWTKVEDVLRAYKNAN